MKPAKVLFCALFFVLPALCFAQQKFSKVKAFYSSKPVRDNIIGLLEIDHFLEEKGAIISEVNAALLSRLSAYGIKYQILTDDVAKHLQEENNRYFESKKRLGNGGRVALEQSGSTLDAIIPTPAAFQVKSTFGGYYSFTEMEAAMNALVASYPNIAQKISIGKTDERRDIWLIKISDNVATDETDEPEVLYLGLQHAREAITGASMIFFMQYLCEQYGKDNRLKNLVDNREIFIIPCFNPDGWEYNKTLNSAGGGGWRKNRGRDTAMTITIKGKNSPDTTYTVSNRMVDLNRNWGVDWAKCSTPILGPSSSCGSGTEGDDTYWGSTAFSEKETAAVRAFAKSHHLVAGFDQHAYGPYYSLPFGRKSLHQNQMPQKGQDFYTAIPALMGTYNGMRAADSYDALGYEVAGGFKDWMLMGELGVGTKDTVWAMTGEGGAGGGTGGSYGSFWAPASQIINLSKGMCYQNLQLAFAAGTYVDIQDASSSAVALTGGKFNVNVKRLGLGDKPVTITLVPLENIQTVGAPVVIQSMPDYYGTYNREVEYQLAPNIAAGAQVKFAWKVETGGYSYSDTITRFYKPTQLFFDDMEGSFATNWIAVSNAGETWNFTKSSPFSGTQSLTESPTGNYTASANRKVTYKNVLNLTDATSASLSFWVKHRAENFRDKLQVQVSTNSTDGTNGTWTAIGGKTTVSEPGTLDGTTLAGKPSLTGIRDFWSKEYFDLAAYKGTNLRFRFEFTSDADPSSFKFETDDGFYIDNVEVLKTTSTVSTLPVKFVSVTAKAAAGGVIEVSWKATADEENDYYEVERSTTGTGFLAIAKIKSGQPTRYADRFPQPGVNYYRIKQVDTDGTITYSKIVTASTATVTVKIYPNPVWDVLSVEPAALTTGTFNVQITDLRGRIVYQSKNISNSNNSLLIDVKQWKKQVYFLKVYDGAGQLQTAQKILKL